MKALFPEMLHVTFVFSVNTARDWYLLQQDSMHGNLNGSQIILK